MYLFYSKAFVTNVIRRLARPGQTWDLFVFCLFSLTSSALDLLASAAPLQMLSCFRYDLAQFEWIQIQRMLTFRSGGIAIFVYLMSLMLTLVTTRLDDKISLYHINATLFEQSDPKVTFLHNK